jgi:hypothetical protein
MNGVSCVSDIECIAVGQYRGANQSGPFTLVAHWFISQWALLPAPRVPRAASSWLNGVDCTSPDRCMAVGEYTLDGIHQRAFSARWDGSGWTLEPVELPVASATYLVSVSCVGQRSCMAVGWYGGGRGQLQTWSRTLAERWNGIRWSIERPENPPVLATHSLSAVSCTGANACTAVGYNRAHNDNSTVLIERWDGAGWTVDRAPTPSGGVHGTRGSLLGVDCASERSCIAVGSYLNKSGGITFLAEHWNGRTWSLTRPPEQPALYSFLSGVSCSSAQACTAVGWSVKRSGAQRNLAERWNGGGWQSQRPGNGRGGYNQLLGVSCPSGSTCIGVGGDGSRWLGEYWG